MLDQPREDSEEMYEVKISNTSTTTTINTSSSVSESPSIKKTCFDCGTNRTPLWRGGPAGPKSLCNACGIRSRKRRRALLGLTNPETKKNPHHKNKSNKVIINTLMDDVISCGGVSESTNDISGDEKMWSDHVMKMEGLMWRRSTAGKKWRREVVLGEEEQAAVLLMAMAYSCIFV